MASATLTYDPTADSWSTDQPTLHVYPGATAITWNIALAAGANGNIAFDSDPAGIVFDSNWIGSTPSGNATQWSASIVDTEQPGDEPIHFHYSVNALYTAQGNSNPVKVKWDPEVEADPPPPIKIR